MSNINTVTASKFFADLRKGVVINSRVEEDMIIDKIKDFLLVKNCEGRKLTIKNGVGFSHISFENSTFEELEILNVSGKRIDISGGEFGRITIGTSTMKDDDIGVSVEKNDGITIAIVTGVNDISIKDIANSFIFQIYGIECVRMTAESCLATQVEIKSSKFDFFKISKFQTTGSFVLRGVTLSNDSSIFNSKLTGLNFDVCFVSDLYISSCEIQDVNFIQGGTKRLRLADKFSFGNLKIADNDAGQIEILDGKIRDFRLQPAKIESLTIRSENEVAMIQIRKFEFHANRQSSIEFFVSNLACETMKISHFKNDERFELTDSSITKEFRLDFSDMQSESESTALFKNVDFECRSISFYNTTILGAEFSNVRWSSSHRLNLFKNAIKNSSTAHKLRHYWTIKEAYRQLKVVSIENSNRVDANYFQAGELDVYYKILMLKTFNSGWRGYIKHSGDLLILAISKHFGGYGLYIWHPIVWWAIFHSTLVAILTIKRDFGIAWTGFDLSLLDWAATKKGVYLWIQLLNPLHNTTLYGVSIEGMLDFAFRVSASFFLYYTIRSSRKFIFSS